ncbi:energy transducer TonB [Chryseobacterium gambrini]|uniref:Energy transducer TonB n=1 Tax=Chryseobacterium gambrini TaxID=373672 RepID=A0AAJ1R4L7_9FLAO|nr:MULTISPECIES: energy transducer TonB [Chryseobacterium]MDN4012219.1 energy transducer TonB [Chryseobacterium gambrini]MDN4031439.1 energy transducer TonB [Chryseobacterium gambrini]QWA36907.1 energy transducer TonB [Chryseobacterium sp. ZHDP1]
MKIFIQNFGLKRWLILFLMINFGALFFAQSSHIPAPFQPKEIEKIPITTICYYPPDHEAYFPKGREAFIKKVENLITLESVKVKKREKTLTAMLNFTVEKDGSLIEIQALGSNNSFNAALEEAVKHVQGKWIPAQQNGYLVRNKIQIPVSINLK